MHKAVALDPGGTTGYAIAYIGEPKRLYFTYGQHPWKEAELWEALKRLQPDSLICESFEYRQNSRAGLDLTPVRLIGVVNLYAALEGCRLHMQTAAKGKAWWTDDALKRHLIYDRSYRHGRDACRHLLHWFMFGAGFKYNDLDQKDKFGFCMVDEQYLLDSYFDRVAL